MQLLEISFNCLEEAESNIPVSPLHLAVSEPLLQTVNQLWSIAGNVHATPPSLQAYYGHCEALRLLSETLVCLDVRDIEGRTALHLAAQRGFALCVEMLLKHQASYRVKEHKRRWTALHAAGVCARVTGSFVSVFPLWMTFAGRSDMDTF